MVCTASPFNEKEEDLKKVDLAAQPERMVSNIMPKETKKGNDFNVKENSNKQLGDQNALVFIYPSPIASNSSTISEGVWVD